jgi:hypothetical protein
MGEDADGGGREDRSPLPLRRDDAVYGVSVYALVHGDPRRGTKSVVDLAGGEAARERLRSRDHTVLAAEHLRHRVLWSTPSVVHDTRPL